MNQSPQQRIRPESQPTISRLRVSGFKSIKHADVELGPCTVIVGKNSSGKSSLLQSLLALSQSAQANTHLDRGTEFKLNSDLVNLGEFNDVAHKALDAPPSDTFSVAVEFRFQGGYGWASKYQGDVRCQAKFELEKPGSGARRHAEITRMYFDWDFNNFRTFKELSTLEDPIVRRGGELALTDFGVQESDTIFDLTQTDRFYSGIDRAATATATGSMWSSVRRGEEEVREQLVDEPVLVQFYNGLPARMVNKRDPYELAAEVWWEFFTEWFDLDRPDGSESESTDSTQRASYELADEVARFLFILDMPIHDDEMSIDSDVIDERFGVSLEELTRRAIIAREQFDDVQSEKRDEQMVVEEGTAALEGMLERMKSVLRGSERAPEILEEIESLSYELEQGNQDQLGLRFESDQLSRDRRTLHQWTEEPRYMQHLLPLITGHHSEFDVDELTTISDTWRRSFLSMTKEKFAQRLRNTLKKLGVSWEGKSVPSYSRSSMATFPLGLREAAMVLRLGVHYLGPLRQQPVAIHQDRQGQINIGIEGEFTASVLHAYGSQMVRRPQNLASDTATEGALIEVLNEEVQLLDLSLSVETQEEKHGIELRLKAPSVNEPLNLTSVGVGVSQVLPVLVRCLLADPGDVVILEQPELHLHPATEQRLADFFVRCARSGRQLIIETHTEHLVNRLRLRSTEDETGETGKLVKLLFAEQVNGATEYKMSDISAAGTLDDEWPEGFLDISARESEALLDQMLQRRLENLDSE